MLFFNSLGIFAVPSVPPLQLIDNYSDYVEQ
nr:MAG TPA: hypothetical protein [Caudoviricetes sp.]